MNNFFKLHLKRFSYCLYLSLFVVSCLDDSPLDPSDHQLNDNQLAAIEYFKEIALGFEFGGASEVTRKWKQNMRIFVDGSDDEVLYEELQNIIDELNDLVSADSFSIRITSDSSSSNFYLFLGSGVAYAQRVPEAKGLVGSNFGLFFVRFNSRNEFISGTMYVDIFRATEEKKKHLLREELTQSLGMAKDSPRYPGSIFQSSYQVGCATEYAPIDKTVIQLLYHPDMKTGLNSAQVDGILLEIIESVLPNNS